MALDPINLQKPQSPKIYVPGPDEEIQPKATTIVPPYSPVEYVKEQEPERNANTMLKEYPGTFAPNKRLPSDWNWNRLINDDFPFPFDQITPQNILNNIKVLSGDRAADSK